MMIPSQSVAEPDATPIVGYTGHRRRIQSDVEPGLGYEAAYQMGRSLIGQRNALPQPPKNGEPILGYRGNLGGMGDGRGITGYS